MARPVEQVCLPIPRVWQVDGDERAPQVTNVRSLQPVCPRAERYALIRLAECSVGNVELAVSKPCSDVPALGDDESYCLEVTKEAIRISANETWGALRGISTLEQLGRGGALTTSMSIDDEPRFPWRGVLLDPARHFISLDVLQTTLVGLASLKINVLHLHLSDDQGFRFASDAFPKLASAQCYSKSDLSSLVTLAADLGIRVIPELDMPGHVNCWLTAYPEWGAQTAEPSDRFGVHKACLDVSSSEVRNAVQTLWAEVAEVFPDEYVHIGGDEVHPEWWQSDSNIQAYQQANQLPDMAAVQNDFNRFLVTALEGIGKKVVAWDEVLHADMPNMLVQNWRGATTRDVALAQGQDVLVSAPYYLDLHMPADMHYAFDPAEPQEELLAIEDQQQADPRLAHVAEGIGWTRQWRKTKVEGQPLDGRILGGEACLWAELVDARVLPVRLFSRLPAVAERLWSEPERCDVEGFYLRLEQTLGQAPLALAEIAASNLSELGLSQEQIDTVSLLEPVKWYGRLLGEVALSARIRGEEMPQARPYDTQTPLDRIVDLIAPESLAARSLQHSSAEQWQEYAATWAALDVQSYPDDVHGAVSALRSLGEFIRNGANDLDRLDDLYGPWQEYVVAPVIAYKAWRALN